MNSATKSSIAVLVLGYTASFIFDGRSVSFAQDLGAGFGILLVSSIVAGVISFTYSIVTAPAGVDRAQAFLKLFWKIQIGVAIVMSIFAAISWVKKAGGIYIG